MHPITEKISAIPQASQGNSVWNITVFVHPCTASMNDSSRETYKLKLNVKSLKHITMNKMNTKKEKQLNLDIPAAEVSITENFTEDLSSIADDSMTKCRIKYKVRSGELNIIGD